MRLSGERAEPRVSGVFWGFGSGGVFEVMMLLFLSSCGEPLSVGGGEFVVAVVAVFDV